MEPRVLMVVPTLGRRLEHLEECLRSISSQGVEGLDLVVVAPPEPAVDRLTERYGGRGVADPKRGLSGAINAGIDAARPGTSYVGWIGDDDLLAAGSLATTTAALDGDPHASMVYGWCDYIDANGVVVFSSRAGRLAGRCIGFAPNLIPQPGSLMRLTDVRAVGGLDEDLTLSMDLDLYLRLRRRGRLVAVSQTLASFRWHADSTTVRSEKDSAEEADQVRMRYLSRPVAYLYNIARWPGRWALRVVKWRLRAKVRRQRPES